MIELGGSKRQRKTLARINIRAIEKLPYDELRWLSRLADLEMSKRRQTVSRIVKIDDLLSECECALRKLIKLTKDNPRTPLKPIDFSPYEDYTRVGMKAIIRKPRIIYE